MTWTAEQDAALLAKLRLENAAFAAWSAGVQSGNITLGGAEAAAEQAGFRAGLLDFDENTRRAATWDYNARERVAWAGSDGAGDGRPETASRSTGRPGSRT